jgi:hypothetical protein
LAPNPIRCGLKAPGAALRQVTETSVALSATDGAWQVRKSNTKFIPATFKATVFGKNGITKPIADPPETETIKVRVWSQWNLSRLADICKQHHLHTLPK